MISIGKWIDEYLDKVDIKSNIKYYGPEEANMELLNIQDIGMNAYIQSCDSKGNVKWHHITNITRHDPSEFIYKIKTKWGREVSVVASKSLLIWNELKQEFEEQNSEDIKIGDMVPITIQCEPHHKINHIDMRTYLCDKKYIYGTEYNKKGSFNGIKKNFNIQNDHIYLKCARRTSIPIKDTFELSRENGFFIGMFLAEGNTYKDYVNIANNDSELRNKIEKWFESNNISHCTQVKPFNLDRPGLSTSIRGYSTLLVQFINKFVGKYSNGKYIPNEAFIAPDEFIQGLIDGYISGDGCITDYHVVVSSVSRDLIYGVSQLLTRYNIFTKISIIQQKSNNIGSPIILPRYILSVQGRYVYKFAKIFTLSHSGKQAKLSKLVERNTLDSMGQLYKEQNNVILDPITSIEKIKSTDFEEYNKVYDITVPDTLNFQLFNGMQVRDTSETGYIQRKLVKAMEDNKVYYDQTVRNANEGIVQFLYGEDGMEGTKIEAQNLNYIDMDLLDIEKEHRMYFEETFKMYLTEKVFTDTMKSSTIRKRCEDHFQQLLEDRLFLIEKVFKNQKMDRITYPIPFERIIKNAVNRMKDMGLDSLPSNLSPEYILDEIEELISGKTCLKVTSENQGMKFLHILLRMHLSPKPMIYKYHMQKETFDWILSEIRRYFKEAVTPAGEMVGIIAAQSLGEPATQLTLDSFHVSGTAAAVKATSGVPRLKELLSVSKNIKTPTLQIYLKPDISHTVNATEDQQGNINDPRVYEAKERTFKVLKQLEITKLVDLLETTEIFWDPPGQKGLQTNIENDNQYLAIYREFTKLDSSRCRSTSPWVLRMVLDKTRVYRANLSMLDIYMKIYQAYGNTIECLFSDDNDEELIFQMRINENALKDVDSEDMVAALKAIEYNIVHTILLKGVTKINKVSMRVYNHMDYNKDKQQFDKINEWILDTDGSNLIEIMANPNVDPYRTFTNDIHEIFNVLGIEAARNALSNEIMEVIKESSVNYRHLSLLMDTMTCKGALMSVDRHGINRGDVGPLAKSSFEETTDMLIKSSIFSEFDRINGVSANIMLGQLPPCGTGDSEILLDEQDYISLVKDRINYIPSAGMEEVDACHMEALKFSLPNIPTQQKTKMSELPEVTFV